MLATLALGAAILLALVVGYLFGRLTAPAPRPRRHVVVTIDGRAVTRTVVDQMRRANATTRAPIGTRRPWSSVTTEVR